MRLAIVSGLLMLAGVTLVSFATTAVHAQSQATVRIDNVDVSSFPSVRVTATVMADHKPKLGLEEADFDVLQAGAPVEQLRVMEEFSGAVDLVIAIDVSRSQADYLGASKDTAIALVDALGSGDRAALVSFADATKPLVGLTNDKNALRQAIQGLEAGAYTYFYNGLFVAVDTAANGPAPGKAVVVMSDGQEYPEYGREAQRDPQDILDRAENGGVQVYTIHCGIERPSALFEEIAAITSGKHFSCQDGKVIQELTAHLRDTLRQRYVLEVQHNGVADGDSTDLTVRVKANGDTDEKTTSLCQYASTPLVWLPQIRSGSKVEGTVELQPVIACNRTIVQAEYFLDGNNVASPASSPFAYTLFADKLDRGNHLLTLRVVDATGAEATTEVQFSVSGSTFNPAYLFLVAGAAAVVALAIGIVMLRRRARKATAPAGAPPALNSTAVYEELDRSLADSAGAEVRPVGLRQGEAHLIAVGGPTVGQAYALTAKSVVIGRAPECDIVLSGAAVSRKHAKIWRENGGWLVQDLNSTNGTKVNDRKITRVELTSGDEIQVGEYRLRFALPQRDRV